MEQKEHSFGTLCKIKRQHSTSRKSCANLSSNKELFISDSIGDIRSYYDLSETPLGEGAFGVVYLGTEKATGEKRAVKVIEKSKIKNFTRFHNEIYALKTLDHPHIIKLYEIFKDEDHVYLVQELCTGGELFDYIVEQEYLTEEISAKIFHQLMQSIMYCHKNRIAHRDLKPENFMLKSKDGELCVKLIDFGLSCSYMTFGDSGSQKLKKMTTKAGTLFFMAPEVLKHNYSNKCDIWSAGVILYIMLCGYPPFASEDDAETVELINEGEVEFDDEAWELISDEAKDLISKMLVTEKERLSSKKCLSHPWVKKYSYSRKKGKLLDSQLSRLKEFQHNTKFRKVILSYLSTRVSDDDIKQEKDLFNSIDKNKDGYITVKELQEVTKDTMTELDIKNILMSIDLDKNGAINYSEFIAASMNEIITKDASKMKTAFDFFDRDKNGFIERHELKEILSKNNDEMLDELLIDEVVNECDLDGDGKIDYLEFYRCMSMNTD
ncbi:unnamed protein product [Moneuplotes crassus]|uniref:non-specific serine/threonine protein kinase n=1 Tax=Euplotes crassus TaxID=5936 RepID=A0AAD1UCA0_EUPCR|nr:unnamed protein product [Moneuplotes crassus]